MFANQNRPIKQAAAEPLSVHFAPVSKQELDKVRTTVAGDASDKHFLHTK
ncbi:hypothetical protein GCM10027565_28110 [Bordetella tumulicola]